jgi:GcrA cell cycle regulator
MTNMPTTNERYWGPSGGSRRSYNPKWDDEGNVKELRQLHADGFSAGKIAKKLGFSSRNAVIGKLHRLGIVKSRPVGQRAHLNQPALPVSRGEKISKGLYDYSTVKRINEQRKHKPRVKLPEDETPPIVPEITNTLGAAFDAAIPIEERRTLLELTSFTCRWPIGDPSTADFYFCGGYADIEKPYCRVHTMRAIRR